MSELFDIQAIIVKFVADPACSSIELPHMTTGQRKLTKRILEQYPELVCKSYGFGKDRKLHLFKPSGESTSMEDARIDDLLPMANEPLAEPLMVDAVPESLSKTAVKCFMDGPVCKLDLTSIQGATDMPHGWGEASCTDGSTAPPSPCGSDGSPASTFQEALPQFRLPPGLEVQNTFLHYKSPPLNERAVQTMPHSMFRRCLLMETLRDQPKKVQFRKRRPAERCLPTASTEVVIGGLSKLPAFNGLRGTLQSLDEQSGRYTILLASPVCGHKTAKVKRENFRVVSTSESLQLFPERADPPRPLRLAALL